MKETKGSQHKDEPDLHGSLHLHSDDSLITCFQRWKPNGLYVLICFRHSQEKKGGWKRPTSQCVWLKVTSETHVFRVVIASFRFLTQADCCLLSETSTKTHHPDLGAFVLRAAILAKGPLSLHYQSEWPGAHGLIKAHTIFLLLFLHFLDEVWTLPPRNVAFVGACSLTSRRGKPGKGKGSNFFFYFPSWKYLCW